MESGFLSGPRVDFQDATSSTSSQGRKAEGDGRKMKQPSVGCRSHPGEWAHWGGVEAPVGVKEGLGEPSSNPNGSWGRRNPWSQGAEESKLGPQGKPAMPDSVRSWKAAVAWRCKIALGTDPTPDFEDEEPLLCWRGIDPKRWVRGPLRNCWHPISSLAMYSKIHMGKGLEPTPPRLPGSSPHPATT